MFQRIILIVLDGVGIGALPDAEAYGDRGSATLQHVAASVGGLNLPQLEAMGLGWIDPIAGVKAVSSPTASWGKMIEKSPGKHSVTGHWELAGIILDQPFATFPNGFPEQIIASFVESTGLHPLGNIAASGTDILRNLGEEHLSSGRPIIYTSSDSVFQIAAHEDVIAPDQLYRICRQAEKALEPYNLCRVIARPFRGTCAADFYRTGGRHDFPLKPPEETLLKLMQNQGLTTYGIGKIHDLFAGDGLTEFIPTGDNQDGMLKTVEALSKIKQGLVMTNLVDFDMLYGHRLNPQGFAEALEAFDVWLPRLFAAMSVDDLLIITADHGCDPTTPGTDHSREYVPLLVAAPLTSASVNLGVRQTFADVGATVADNFQLKLQNGQSFLSGLNVHS
ncbi:MAG: phosphopentomutase [Deltaproteobacteria bacterium]|nr:phosphopentomutase [Deltaproteobacteria bacterium]